MVFIDYFLSKICLQNIEKTTTPLLQIYYCQHYNDVTEKLAQCLELIKT